MGDVIKFVPPNASGKHPEPHQVNPIRKWAQRIALGTAMVGGGYQVGHERGRAEVLKPEVERIEEDAETLLEELDERWYDRNYAMATTSPFVPMYLDESGSLSDLASHFVVAVCVNIKVERIERIMRKVRRHIPKKKQLDERRVSEFKFSSTTVRTRKKVLELLARTGVEVAVLAIDKGGKAIADRPEQYGAIVGALLGRCYRRYSHIALCLDIHFTKQEDQRKLAAILQQGATEAQGVLQIEMGDSQRKHALQIADFLAGAFYSKYTRGSDEYTRIIASHVVDETVLRWPIPKTKDS